MLRLNGFLIGALTGLCRFTRHAGRCRCTVTAARLDQRWGLRKFPLVHHLQSQFWADVHAGRLGEYEDKWCVYTVDGVIHAAPTEMGAYEMAYELGVVGRCCVTQMVLDGPKVVHVYAHSVA